MILSRRYFKPQEHTNPSIQSIIFFFLAEALVIPSCVLYFQAYNSLNSFFTSINNFDHIIPTISDSLSSSLQNIVNNALSQSIGPLSVAFTSNAYEAESFINKTARGLLDPAYDIQHYLFSTNSDDMGVFGIYSDRLAPTAQGFYQKADTFQHLDNLTRYFVDENCDEIQEMLDEFLDEATNFTHSLEPLNYLFRHFYSLIDPLKIYINELKEQDITGAHKTFQEIIDEISAEKMENVPVIIEIHTKFRNIGQSFEYCI